VGDFDLKSWLNTLARRLKCGYANFELELLLSHMFESETRKAIDLELARADQARQAGNEGMARVCARRAAGIALRQYFIHNHMEITDPSAISLLTRLIQMESTPADIKSVVDNLLTRVTPDYRLPILIDLTAQAKVLIAWVADQTRGDRLD